MVVCVPPERWRDVLAGKEGTRADAAVVRADLPGHRPLAGLLAIELRTREVPAAFVTSAPGLVATRRALAGLEPGGELGRRTSRLAARIRRAGRPSPGRRFRLCSG